MRKINFAFVYTINERVGDTMEKFSLCSCQVNVLNATYDVSWWIITVLTVVLIFAVLYAVGKYISKKKYVCPNCNKTFYPKWWEAAFSLHVNDDRVLKCPHCKKKSFCHLSWEQ